MMPILSIETSGELCSVAVLKSENNYYEINLAEKNIHSEKLMPAIDELINFSGISIKEIKAIAVSVGPGSFTGLRIGMSVAKGLAYGAGLPLVPVKTYHALALEISSFLPKDTVFIICNVLNTTELFFSKFKANHSAYEIIEDVTVIPKTEFDSFVTGEELIFGNYRKSKEPTHSVPSAKFVGLWSYFFGKDLLTFSFDYLEPDYIKKFIPRKGQ